MGAQRGTDNFEATRGRVRLNSRMPDRSKFRRNLIVVTLVHVALVAALYLGGLFRSPPPQTGEVIWLAGGSTGGDETGPSAPEPPLPPPPAGPEPIPEPEPARPEPTGTIESVPPPRPEPVGDTDLAVPKATPTPKPTTPKPSTPKATTPKPATPKPKPTTPKPTTPKTTPKAKPTASPTAKTSPKPAASASPKAAAKTSPKPDSTAKTAGATKPKASPGPAKGQSVAAKTAGGGPGPKSSGEGTGVGKGRGSGREGGGDRATDFSWYYLMIHDRFHARWEQPTSIVREGAKFVTTLKLRIAGDGRILQREIVNSSGSPIMDESVLTAATNVKQIDPLPKGLGNGDFFDINVNFKLDQDQ